MQAPGKAKGLGHQLMPIALPFFERRGELSSIDANVNSRTSLGSFWWSFHARFDPGFRKEASARSRWPEEKSIRRSGVMSASAGSGVAIGLPLARKWLRMRHRYSLSGSVAVQCRSKVVAPDRSVCHRCPPLGMRRAGNQDPFNFRCQVEMTTLY